MDKGIRPYANARFIELLPQRSGSSDRKVNLAWRKALLVELMEKFTITIASASTHYNEAFKNARKVALEPGNEALGVHLVGLGRPEDKKGGRKKKVQGPAADTPAATTETPQLTQEQQAEAEADAQAQAVKLYSVFRKKDDTLVAKDLTREQADALIEKAVKAKKGALYLEDQTAE